MEALGKFARRMPAVWARLALEAEARRDVGGGSWLPVGTDKSKFSVLRNEEVRGESRGVTDFSRWQPRVPVRDSLVLNKHPKPLVGAPMPEVAEIQVTGERTREFRFIVPSHPVTGEGLAGTRPLHFQPHELAGTGLGVWGLKIKATDVWVSQLAWPSAVSLHSRIYLSCVPSLPAQFPVHVTG